MRWLGRKFFEGPLRGPLLRAGSRLLYRDRFRRILMGAIDPWLRRAGRHERGVHGSAGRIQRERMLMARAVLRTVDRMIEGRRISPHVMCVITDLWSRAWSLSARQRPDSRRFREVNGSDPPWFLVLSPGNACNLNCPGCYADGRGAPACLAWPVLERVMAEAKDLWGVPLFVFSGGEPLLYRSEGKGLLDAVERHPDSLFLMFTNGTQIDEGVARRMERMGNLTPALSVEGLQATTDRRRGAGHFEGTLEAMSKLREAGVPFGISVTITRGNFVEVLSDRFLDFFFKEQGAFYGFYFHYMPIGRQACLDWMPTPAQRVEVWRRTWEVIERRGIFLFDFWNHGPMVGGCMSAGRQGGYLYIDWDGQVMPCVFTPYAVADINEVYARGETLNHVWQAPFLRTIRDWQRRYGYAGGPVPTPEGNWMRPCPIRDHYPLFRRWLADHSPEPRDETARTLSQSDAYQEGMKAYGAELRDPTMPIWDEVYLGSVSSGSRQGR
jgi:MoaA/NifB/PqqE/SkfB family radical SAM enzyme